MQQPKKFQRKDTINSSSLKQEKDQKYLQWLRDIQQKLSNDKNNKSIKILNEYERKSEAEVFLNEQQKYKQSLKKYDYSYNAQKQSKLKTCEQLKKNNNQKNTQKQQQNRNVIPISHRRERSLSPIKTEEECNTYFKVQEKEIQNTPKISLQYYSKKWSNPRAQEQNNSQNIGFKDMYKTQNPKNKKTDIFFKTQTKKPSNFQYADSQYQSQPKIISQFRSQKKPNSLFHEKNSNFSSIKKSSIVEVLQQKDEEYLKNVYPQTIKYLNDMIQTLNQDKLVLIDQKHKIKQSHFEAIDRRAQQMKQNLFRLIEQTLVQWKQKQYKNVQKKQMKYFGQLLEVQDMIQQRQKQLAILRSRLQQDVRHYRQSQADMNIRGTFGDILSGNHKDQIINLSKQLQNAIQVSRQLSIKSIKQKQIELLDSFNSQQFNALKQVIFSCFSCKQELLNPSKQPNKQIGTIKLENDIRDQNNPKASSSKSLLKDYQKIYSEFRKDFDKKYQSFILQSAKQKITKASELKAQKQTKKQRLPQKSIYSL